MISNRSNQNERYEQMGKPTTFKIFLAACILATNAHKRKRAGWIHFPQKRTSGPDPTTTESNKEAAPKCTADVSSWDDNDPTAAYIFSNATFVCFNLDAFHLRKQKIQILCKKDWGPGQPRIVASLFPDLASARSAAPKLIIANEAVRQ